MVSRPSWSYFILKLFGCTICWPGKPFRLRGGTSPPTHPTCPPARPHARLPACRSACTLACPTVQLLLRSQTLATRWLARQLACPVASHLPVHLFGRPPACPHSCTIALMHACMPARPRAHPPDRTPTGSSAHTPAKHTAASAPARELVWQLACLLARSHARPPTGSPA